MFLGSKGIIIFQRLVELHSCTLAPHHLKKHFDKNIPSLKLTAISHLKIGRAPKGKYSIPSIHFQVQTVSFGECNLDINFRQKRIISTFDGPLPTLGQKKQSRRRPIVEQDWSHPTLSMESVVSKHQKPWCLVVHCERMVDVFGWSADASFGVRLKQPEPGGSLSKNNKQNKRFQL